MTREPLVLAVVFGLACAGEPESARDAAGDVFPIHEAEAAEPDPVRSSHYLAMRDGTRIAVDVTLPGSLGPQPRVGAILHQTRYWRSVELRWPLSALSDAPNERGDRYARHGYAVVSVDARGSGASFGWRSSPWSPDEVRDAIEVVEWIVAQPWSNGRVATDWELEQLA